MFKNLKIKCPQLLYSARFYVGQYKKPFNISPSEEQDLLIKKMVSRNVPLSNKEWKQLRDSVLEHRFINEVNIDSTILGYCVAAECSLDVGKSYVDYLKNEGQELNFATLGKLLKMYFFASLRNEIEETDKQEIYEIYKNLTEKHSILDANTCEHLIIALSITPQWKKCLELLDMAKITCTPNVLSYSCIAQVCFNNDEVELGWKIMEEMADKRKLPRCEVYLSWIDYASRNKKTMVENIEKVLKFTSDKDILVSKLVVEKLRKVFEEIGKECSFSTVNKRGKCSSCKETLTNISVSNEDFKKLSDSFLDSVLIRKNIFIKSNPEELMKFTRFVDKTIPYDCVIDGLNVAFSTGNHSKKVFANLLASVVKFFATKNQTVLVLGRKHMETWPRQEMGYVKRNSHFFLTDNLSQDDPFLLYAALKSGQNTNFFSRDLMRSHSFLLSDELKLVFRRWQQEHQYSLTHVTDYGKIIVKEPFKFQLNAHKSGNCWHIPFIEEYTPTPPQTFDIPNSWLCVNIK